MDRQLAGNVLERDEYLRIARSWLAAFEAFLSQNTLDEHSMRGARVLQISQALGMVMLDVQDLPNRFRESSYDRYLSYFQRIVALARQNLQPTSLNSVEVAKDLCFSVDTHVVAPLYAVIHKCRDPSVRREAVRLLKLSPRREGIWDGLLAGQVGEKIISLEEEGLGLVASCHDVPEWARVKAVSVDFDMEGRLGTIKYTRQRGPNDPELGEYIENVRW